jgi:hypothetical protein
MKGMLSKLYDSRSEKLEGVLRGISSLKYWTVANGTANGGEEDVEAVEIAMFSSTMNGAGTIGIAEKTSYRRWNADTLDDLASGLLTNNH